MKFVRNHAIGLLALCVALGGTAVAANSGPSAQTARTKAKIRQVQMPLRSENGTSSQKVRCKRDERVTGGGYRFGTPLDLDNSIVVTNAPHDKRTWAVEITSISPGPWEGAVQAYAICAKS